MVRSASNPQAMMYQAIQNNPNTKQVFDYIRQNGGDPKTAFYKMAEQKGVDPNEILNMLK